MGYGIGLAPNANGTGSEPEDLQRWIWSLYRADSGTIARGLEVTPTSTMSYAVAAGVAIIPVATARAIAVPVDAVTVPTSAAPSSGTRTDYIYVGADGAVKVGGTQAANTALLDKRTVSAGTTATTATTSQLGNRKYAPLFGSTMGMIARWEDPLATGAKVPNARTKVGSLTFTLDSDRRLDMGLQVSYDQEINANTGTDSWKVASFQWEIFMDGQRVRWTELAVHSWPEVKQDRLTFTVNAGTHTIEIYRERRLMSGGDIYYANGSKRPDTSLVIMDVGGVS